MDERYLRGDIIFQSTLPHGSDWNFVLYTARDTNFNPRSLTGATNTDDDKVFGYQISIHAPSRERRQQILAGIRARGISIHAPSRERPMAAMVKVTDFNFNPRSLTGATVEAMALASLLPFQSTLPHGSDHMPRKRTSVAMYFNPRSLTGATLHKRYLNYHTFISIHAPSRERPAASY